MMGGKRTYYFEDTKEERRARDIYAFLTTRKLSPDEFNYEIVDCCCSIKPRYTYVLKPDFNIRFLEICLATFGIKKRFKKNGKKYLVLYSK